MSTSIYESIISLLKNKHFKQAEILIIPWLRQDKLDAQLWVFLGEALLQQGYGLAANRVFQRAWLLDPQASWVQKAFNSLKQVPDGDERYDIEGLLHVPKVSIAAAILSFNEEMNIGRCIEALQDAVDEIVLIDSSTDKTESIAANYDKVKIVKIDWNDSFADARNKGLQHIQSDWVVWIDADEVLASEDKSSIKEVAGLFHGASPIPALHVWHLNQVRGSVQHDFSQTRMFPMRRGLRFWGRIHEQLGTQEGIFNKDIVRRSVKIRLHHNGYEPAVLQNRNKIERNLRLLNMMIREEPNNPGHWLFYGRESIAGGFKEQAQAALHQAEQLAQSTPHFGSILEIYKLLIFLSIESKDYRQAEAYCHKALEHNLDYPDAHYLLAQVRMKQADELFRQAENSLKQSIHSLSTYRCNVTPDYQIGEWKAEVALGELAMRAGKLSNAKRIFAKHANRPELQTGLAQKLTNIEAERQRLNQIP
ncbi:glycosyltransferase [Paenibacillus sedimenti]|uniref:Glycosyltransferase n=1 Tax=Paenibacillus sedimenti TaxID=2770274 RepID=A0A926KNF8_9BACL|nr:glycosyltransferase [Paenibacillus sedimenti]MBD0381077.1 glycosyltransferase [Paenibacillus sedimenti]